MSPSAPEPTIPDRRNELALIRTDLANERTLLAYARTSLMIAGTGATVIKFFGDSRDKIALGITLLIIGVALFVVGVTRFVKQQGRIRGDDG
ncbi:YidH family protein [Allorhodopirellula heiligendammensis]|uniref:DUF202 domain-containing protein n=1 Tax=Allorhodopirellula heiligendammensis TaxID=2714739 RepID=A0A5C6BVK9_9BACT|nr:DUF202 domain-containing protein [Allorhodopirellula heiligendammensis]TWU15912.1 hypothetical protein Poly21_31160 [Allorhodopirellula heiligendammensis]